MTKHWKSLAVETRKEKNIQKAEEEIIMVLRLSLKVMDEKRVSCKGELLSNPHFQEKKPFVLREDPAVRANIEDFQDQRWI
ncbi:hypothetical protein Aduo_001588 [Ancylostoma duodenale]